MSEKLVCKSRQNRKEVIIMKKELLLIMVIIFTVSMVAFVAGSEVEAANEPETIVYLAPSVAMQWGHEVKAAFEELGKKYNFNVITLNSDTPDEQLEKLTTVVAQKVDGIIISVNDKGIAPAVVEMCNEADIPVIGESLKLTDVDGNLIAPCVELDARRCGVICSEWIYYNYESLGIDLGDYSKVGFLTLTLSSSESVAVRAEGARERFDELFPDFPEDHKFIGDVVAESDIYQEGAFNVVSAITTAHSDLDKWLVVADFSDHGQGAIRALEAKGLADNSIVTCVGSTYSINGEWDSNNNSCLRATVYFTGMDCAELVIDGLLKIIREGVAPEDIYPEWEKEGKYAAAKFTGQMITPYTYKEIVSR